MERKRHEIDGLRGFAVVAVILFHGGFNWFRGGYAGVDVFFVISGYLITSQILSDKEKYTFSLINFYERRTRRILPALYFILFFCLPFAYNYLLPKQLKEFAQGLISITFFSSNILFWMKEGYFAEKTEYNPLVHTWSLAVEEQFYMFFPLLIMTFWKTGKRALVKLLIIMALSSLLLAQWSGNLCTAPPFVKSNLLWFSQQSWASFYLLTGRVWELLIGTLAAFYLHHNIPERSVRNEAIGVAGFVFIIYSIFSFDVGTPFPSFYTLTPTVGTALIILYGNSHTFIGRFLSWRIFTNLGLISYSAYLWHQPLLAFARINSENSLDTGTVVGLCVTSFILAYLSWRFVEQPCRDRAKFTRKQIFSGALFCGSLIIIIAFYFLLTDGAKNRFTSADLVFFRLQEKGNQGYLDVRFNSIPSTDFQNNSASRKILIIGDSFAMDFVNMVAENGKFRDSQVRIFFVDSRCQIYLGQPDRQDFIMKSDIPVCQNKNDIIHAGALIKHADIIIMAASWRRWSAAHLPTTIQMLKLSRNQKLFIIGTKSFSKMSLVLYLHKPLAFRLEQNRRPSDEVIQINNLMEKTLNSSIFVNLMKMLCGVNFTCPVFTPDGNFISPDGGHLSQEGARYVGRVIFEQYPLNLLN